MIAEHFSDDRGLVWPAQIAPAKVHLISLGDEPEVTTEANRLYQAFKDKQIGVIYDDRDMRAGEKFADADLLGIPARLVVSKKTLGNDQPSVEYKARTSQETEIIPIESIIERFQ